MTSLMIMIAAVIWIVLWYYSDFEWANSVDFELFNLISNASAFGMLTMLVLTGDYNYCWFFIVPDLLVCLWFWWFGLNGLLYKVKFLTCRELMVFDGIFVLLVVLVYTVGSWVLELF